MKISDIYYQQFNAACHLGYSSKRSSALYIKWQKQLKVEGEFYVYGKPMSVLAW